MPNVYYKSDNFSLLQGDCIKELNSFDFKFDMIFADPPYHLSNGGFSIQSGKIVSVNKGNWDKSQGFEEDYIFDKTWEKTSPPPNLSCRFFTYSAEYILWARKEVKTPHYFNYELMKQINGGTQMRDVWRLPTVAMWEKHNGKHPTQKPLCLLSRIILASTKPGAWILDPFAGSSTTGIAANLLERRFLGIEQESKYLDLSILRKKEIDTISNRQDFLNRLNKQSNLYQDKEVCVLNETDKIISYGLPF